MVVVLALSFSLCRLLSIVTLTETRVFFSTYTRLAFLFLPLLFHDCIWRCRR